MKVIIVGDGHYLRDREGRIYSDAVYNYTLYSRYTRVFSLVYVIARVKDVEYPPHNKLRADGDGVVFLPLPDFAGPIGYLENYFQTRLLLNKYLEYAECAIFRLPGVISNLACEKWIKTNKKFAVEIVADPWEFFKSYGVWNIHILYVKHKWTKLLKKACLIANGVAYVTAHYLQAKYACKRMFVEDKDYFMEAYSSVEILEEQICKPRKYEKIDILRIVHVANSFSNYGKGQIIVMDTVKELIARGYKCNIVFIGDGALMDTFKEYARKLDIFEHVIFAGRLPDYVAVRKILLHADLMLFPTRAEGLPRVLIEAMATGLPCISSGVCGIPEILKNEYNVYTNNFLEYADIITNLLEAPHKLTEMSEENIATARGFCKEILEKKRDSFYIKLRNLFDR